MNVHALLILALSLPVAAQAQVARFDFQNQLGSAQPAFAFVTNFTLNNTHQFAGPQADRTLSLPLSWTAGGTAWFSVLPNYSQHIDYSRLQWMVRPNAPGVADVVSGVTVFANGVQVAALNPIPQNALIDVDLSGFPSLQNQTQQVTFDFVFTGNPAGTSTHDISFLQVLGSGCDFAMHTVTPASLLTASSDWFQVLGTGFQDAQGNSRITEVKFGNTVLGPYSVGTFGPGSYEVFSQYKLRIRPPQCIPPGVYNVVVTSDCDVRSVQVTMVDPTVPVMAAEPLHPAGQTQCYTLHAGGPGPQIVVLVASPVLGPSVVPGLLSLEIGDNFSLYGLVAAVGDCVTFCLPVPITKVDSCHFYQGIVWHSSNPSLTSPLQTSGVIATCWF